MPAAAAAAERGGSTQQPTAAPAAVAAAKSGLTAKSSFGVGGSSGATVPAPAPVLGSSPRSPGSAGAALFGSPGGRPSRSDCLELLADLKAAEAAAATAASLQPAGLLGGSGSNGGGGGSRRSASEAAATGERKRGREAPPAATSSGMNSKQADPARVSANAAVRRQESLRGCLLRSLAIDAGCLRTQPAPSQAATCPHARPANHPLPHAGAGR